MTLIQYGDMRAQAKISLSLSHSNDTIDDLKNVDEAGSPLPIGEGPQPLYEASSDSEHASLPATNPRPTLTSTPAQASQGPPAAPFSDLKIGCAVHGTRPDYLPNLREDRGRNLFDTEAIPLPP